VIERIDSPDRSDFSTVSGYLPYQSKFTEPISAIRYADTIYTVRSLGLKATWYRNPDYTNTAYTGYLPSGIVKLWYGEGFPPEIANPEGLTGWSLKLNGYFKIPTDGGTGDYTFYFGGEGQIDSCTYGSNDLLNDAPMVLKVNDTRLSSSDPITLNNYTWNGFEIKYSNRVAKDNYSGLVVLYDNPSMSEKLVLSGGVTSPTNPGPAQMPISYSSITGYIETNLNIRKEDSSKFTFTMPFVDSADAYTSGMGGIWKKNRYIYGNNDYELKRWRLIEYFEGYKSTASPQQNQLIQKFTGFIDSFNIKYSNEGNDTIEITCLDAKSFTKEQYSLDSPNYIDYIAAGYMSEVPSHVNGETKPRTFDGWELHKVFHTFLTNSYIDPSLFLNKNIYTDRNLDSTTVGYKIKYTTGDPLYLPVQDNYGNVTAIEREGEDDEYLFQVDTGEYYQDAIDKLLETYGYEWGIDRKGYPYLKGINSPELIISDRDMTTSGTWSQDTDFQCIKATYTYSNTITDVASSYFVGKRLDTVFKVGPLCGHTTFPETYSAKVKIWDKTQSSVISSAYLNLYHNQEWSYYDGVDPNTGSNPCIFNIATNLPMDAYYASVIVHSAYTVQIDGLLSYYDDINTPDFYFKTSDYLSPGHIVELDVSDNQDKQRTECIVVGSRTGTKTSIDESLRQEVVNPKNPINTFVMSRAVDLNALHSASGSNYSRPKQTIIVDPSIRDKYQADYISVNFLDEHRDPGKETDFTSLGNPLLEVGDCVSISEEFKQGLTITDKFWITEIQSRFTENGYLTSFNVTDVKPISSYYGKIQPDLSDFNYQAIQNVKIYNGGMIHNLTSQLDSGVSTVLVDGTLGATSPPMGYLMVLKNDSYEIMRYSSVSNGANDSGRYYKVSTSGGLKRGLQRTEDTTWASGSTVIGAWDPYTQDTMGIVPVVKFDCLVNGKVEVKVVALNDSGGREELTSLTGRTKEDWPFGGYDSLDWGENKLFTWNGNDDIGRWNSNNSDDLPEGQDGGFFVAESPGKYYTTVYPEIHVIAEDGQDYSYPVNEFESSRGVVRRGAVSTVNVMIDYSSVYGVDKNGNETLYDQSGYSGYWSKGDNSPLGGYNMMYHRSSVHGGKGIKYYVKDETDDCCNDKYYRRYCNLIIQGNVQRQACLAEFEEFGNTGIYTLRNNKISVDNNQVELINHQDYDLNFYIKDGETLIGRNYYFSPDKENNITFNDKELYNDFIVSSNRKKYFVANIVYFTGSIRDKSGRECLMSSAIMDHNSDNWDDTYVDKGLYRTQSVGFERKQLGNTLGWISNIYDKDKKPIYISISNFKSEYTHKKLYKEYNFGDDTVWGWPLFQNRTFLEFDQDDL